MSGYQKAVLGVIFVSGLFHSPTAEASNLGRFKLTGYDACFKCCHKTDGITASGKKARANHTVACNWLKFGTKLMVNGQVYTVEDHGAKSLFGSKSNQIKHLDIYFDTHTQARQFGVKYADVQIIP